MNDVKLSSLIFVDLCFFRSFHISLSKYLWVGCFVVLFWLYLLFCFCLSTCLKRKRERDGAKVREKETYYSTATQKFKLKIYIHFFNCHFFTLQLFNTR